MTQPRDVFVTGGTGYIGGRLVPALTARKHGVRVLTRRESASRVPSRATVVVGNALDADSIASALHAGDTLVHLVGTPHPSPSKAEEFVRVDLASVRASVAAARRTGVAHFVYVSVAQPAPMMRVYLEVRAEGEKTIAGAKLTATMLRPWYVLGPGHRWPFMLAPFYAFASLVPSWRADAARLGLVTLAQMVNALVHAVANPPPVGSQRIVNAPAIRAS